MNLQVLGIVHICDVSGVGILQVLAEMGADLEDAVKQHAKNPPTLSAVSSWHRAREQCRKEVQEHCLIMEVKNIAW